MSAAVKSRGTIRASAQETAFGDELALRFPYSETLVDDLKTGIPARHRRWDPGEKVWYITGGHRQAAVDVLLSYHPRAEVPEAFRRNAPVAADDRAPWRRDTPWWDSPDPKPPPRPEPNPVLPEPLPLPVREPDDATPILAVLQCPKCHERHDLAVRVVVETSLSVAKRETTPPEMIAVCPACNTLEDDRGLPGLQHARDCVVPSDDDARGGGIVTALAVTPRVIAALRDLDVDIPDGADRQTILARLEQRVVRLMLTDDIFLRSYNWARWRLGIPLPAQR